MRRCQNCKRNPIYVGATLCADCAITTRMLGVTILIIVGALFALGAIAWFAPWVPSVGQ